MTEADYRRLALSFESAIEASHMGHPDFRVNGRIFATIQNSERGALMLLPEQQAVFVRDYPGAFEPEVGAWGLQGSTRVYFALATEEAAGEAMTLAWRRRAEQTAAKSTKKQASKQASKRTGKPASKQASKRTRKQANKPTGKRARKPASKRSSKPAGKRVSTAARKVRTARAKKR
jgi:hypothetical protein